MTIGCCGEKVAHNTLAGVGKANAPPDTACINIAGNEAGLVPCHHTGMCVGVHLSMLV